MPIHAPRIQLIAATTLCLAAGTATAANQIIDDTLPIEWVTISIHMPDGRVIETVEQRYPSRSRVHLKTGEIPAFKRAAQTSSDPGSAESIVTELTEDEYLELSALDEDTASGAEQISDPQIASEAVAVDQPAEESTETESTGAVRAFKKTAKP